MEDVFKFLLVAAVIVIGLVKQFKKEANTVYKISVKDFSSDTASGMTAGGKYSAFTEKGARPKNTRHTRAF